MCATAEVLLCSNAAARATAREGVSDAAERSTPALENSTARSALATRLGQLEAAIEAGNITSARASLDQARAAIATARGLTTFPGDAADLTVIELMLDYVGPLLI